MPTNDTQYDRQVKSKRDYDYAGLTELATKSPHSPITFAQSHRRYGIPPETLRRWKKAGLLWVNRSVPGQTTALRLLEAVQGKQLPGTKRGLA